MKISLVIPHLALDDEKKRILQIFLSSVKGQYNELIIIDDNLDNLSKKINIGLHKSKGDYIMVANDDVELIEGKLNYLCVEGIVVAPTVLNSVNKLFHGHFWAFSRKVYKKVGDMFEGYDGFYYDDSDYWMQILSKGVKIIRNENVIFNHKHPATTLSKLYKPGREEANRRLFIKRWGFPALDIVR